MRGISKQDAIRRARLKLIKTATFQNKALATKRPEMRDGWLASKARLKGSQMQNQAHEDSIRYIACSADKIGPKASWSPMLIEHRPSHFNYSVVLSFHDSILLWDTRVRELLINTMLKTKLIERGIPKLSPIVTTNTFQAVGMLIIRPQSHALKVLKHFILALQEENPRVMRIVINDDKNIPLGSHGVNPRGTDSVHME
jgi:hypothetical protein